MLVPRRRRRGFSLVEVMVVVAVIGIAVGLAVPNITGLVSRRNANATALRVQKAIEGARDTARAQRRCVTVERGATSSTLNITIRPVAGGTCSFTGGTPVSTVFDPRYVDLPPTVLDFGRDGSVVVAADHLDYVFTVLSEGSSSARTLRVFKALGLVRVL